MNTEEKAKAYDEALEKAKDFYKGYKQRDNQLYADDLETIFPELCESEDERVRKEIISFIQDHIDEINLQVSGDYDTRDKEDIALQEWCKKAIAWLEKQKEYESTDFEYVWNRTDCGALTSALDKYSEEAIINMCHAWYDKGIELERKSWVEKQGYTKKDVDDAYLKGICDAKHELEKQGEERTINYPIEGMFPYTEPADTLDGEIENIWNKLRNCDNTFTAAKSGFYEVIHHFANWLEKQGCQKSVDKGYTFKSIPRLLDMIEPTDRAKSYCKKLIDSLQTEGYSVDAKIVGECLKQMNGEKVAMAVMDNEKQDEKKSQRMVSAEAKEALYDKPTDEEMKELLRTEYEKGRADAYCEMYVPTQISPEESLGVSSEKYEDIVDTLTQGGQKPAKWSLEDERVIAIINNALTESNTPPDDYDKVYDWLESIKQRIGG